MKRSELRAIALLASLAFGFAGCAIGAVPEIPELGGRDGFAVNTLDAMDDSFDATIASDTLDESLDAVDGSDEDQPDTALPPVDITMVVDLPASDLGCSVDPGRACTPGTQQPCGMCGSQTCSEICGWQSCTGQGECAAGTSRPCGACGTQTCTGSCAWGACAGQGSCTPGARRVCGNCGVQTCTASCTWGACASQGECAPGSTRADGCDQCSVRVCQQNCSWGGCGLRAGAACEYRGGRNHRACSACRCGLQWCLNSCQWSTSCTSCCGTCGGCS